MKQDSLIKIANLLDKEFPFLAKDDYVAFADIDNDKIIVKSKCSMNEAGLVFKLSHDHSK